MNKILSDSRKHRYHGTKMYARVLRVGWEAVETMAPGSGGSGEGKGGQLFLGVRERAMVVMASGSEGWWWVA